MRPPAHMFFLERNNAQQPYTTNRDRMRERGRGAPRVTTPMEPQASNTGATPYPGGRGGLAGLLFLQGPRVRKAQHAKGAAGCRPGQDAPYPGPLPPTRSRMPDPTCVHPNVPIHVTHGMAHVRYHQQERRRCIRLARHRALVPLPPPWPHSSRNEAECTAKATSCLLLRYERLHSLHAAHDGFPKPAPSRASAARAQTTHTCLRVYLELRPLQLWRRRSKAASAAAAPSVVGIMPARPDWPGYCIIVVGPHVIHA